MTEGGVDRAGIFHRIAHLDDSRLAEKSPPAYALEQVALMAAEESGLSPLGRIPGGAV